MKTILVPFSANVKKEKIRKCLRVIANKSHYQIHVLHVKNIVASVSLADALAVSSTYVEEELDKKEDMLVQDFMKELESDGYPVKLSNPVGFFDQELISISNKLEPDFILMLTAGAHSLVENLFGTNTSHVFEKIKSPIFVVPAEGEFNQLKTVTIGLHLESENFTAFKGFMDYAEENKLELHFIKIDNTYQLDIISDGMAAKELIKLFPGRIEHIDHKKADDAAKGIMEYASEKHADLVVLFTTRRSLLEKLFHKSVTKDLVLHSDKPLLIYHY